jgi:hypothetical protein
MLLKNQTTTMIRAARTSTQTVDVMTSALRLRLSIGRQSDLGSGNTTI